jgi:hypothetical protein
MKHLYLIILFASYSFSHSQSDLFVSTGSYVYADGTAFTSGPTVAPLYVTDDINLETNGHIYLRNEAQLVQGNDVGNSGIGQLSVYQTGTSNTYMYNYWCSPVGINSGTAGNTNFGPDNTIYGETAAPITSLAATYITEPNYDGVAGTPPTIASFWFYSFTGSTAPPNEYADWLSIDETSGILTPGYGWTMKGNPSGAQQYDFRGRPNNGTISTTLNAGRETLVGNPYPSAIDARAYIFDAVNRTLINSGTLSFWVQDPVNSASHVLVDYRGGYSTYTINEFDPVVETSVPATFDSYNGDGTFNSTGATSSGKNVYRYIPIGQGFMVEGNGTGGMLRTTNAMRIFQKEAVTLSEFFRMSNNAQSTPENSEEATYTSDGLSIMPEGYKRFRLNLDFNEIYTRQLVQTFHHTATDGKDYGLETISPKALDADAYWPGNDEAFNAQAFNFDIDLRIPMVININEEQSLRFRIFDIQNFEALQGIYIHDIESQTYVNLRNQHYELNIEPGNYTERFEIVFTTEVALDIDEFDSNTLTINQNNGSHQLSILNPKNLDITSIEVYNVAGKLLLNGNYNSIMNRYELSTASLSDGVYVVNVKSNTSTVETQKIIIKN